MSGMPSYVAFLRAINLGAKRKFAKDDIRACVESTGATEVATHINTGNVLLTTKLRSRAKLEATLEDGLPGRPWLRGADHRLHARRTAG